MALDVSAPAMQYVAKEVVEPDLQWPWLQLAIPVHLLLHSAKAEIPPANDDRCVTRLLERLGSCGTHSNRNQQRVSFVAGNVSGTTISFLPHHEQSVPQFLTEASGDYSIPGVASDLWDQSLGCGAFHQRWFCADERDV